jgi:lysylphosphatidylglycerol synthase-like protein
MNGVSIARRRGSRHAGGSSRLLSFVLTVAIFALLLRRVPPGSVADAIRDANAARFLAVMIPNAIFYFLWDTLVLTAVVRWFHVEVPYRDLLAVRAASYVVGVFNTNLGRGALAAYLSRRLGAPFLELGSSVLFLVLTEYTQLVIWSMLGLFALRADVSPGLIAVAGGTAGVWLVVRWLLVPRHWSVARTFRLATPGRYARIVLLRAPMFFVSLCCHYYAAHAFGLRIPFGQMLTFLPVIFMIAALPITVAHLGTTQAAWVVFFGRYGSAPQLLAFSIAAHLTFAATRALVGIVWMPSAILDLTAASDRAAAQPVRLHSEPSARVTSR